MVVLRRRRSRGPSHAFVFLLRKPPWPNATQDAAIRRSSLLSTTASRNHQKTPLHPTPHTTHLTHPCTPATHANRPTLSTAPFPSQLNRPYSTQPSCTPPHLTPPYLHPHHTVHHNQTASTPPRKYRHKNHLLTHTASQAASHATTEPTPTRTHYLLTPTHSTTPPHSPTFQRLSGALLVHRLMRWFCRACWYPWPRLERLTSAGWAPNWSPTRFVFNSMCFLMCLPDSRGFHAPRPRPSRISLRKKKKKDPPRWKKSGEIILPRERFLVNYFTDSAANLLPSPIHVF